MLAADRNLLIDQTRDNGIAAAIEMPGVSAITLARGLYTTSRPPRCARRSAPAGRRAAAAGAEGRQVLRDIDTYLVGINLWYRQNRPAARPVDRADIYAINAIKAQYLGEGGGDEVANALLLDAARDRFGARRGNEVYEDLRGRNDPETPTTGAVPAPWETERPGGAGARGLVRLEQGTFETAGARAARARTRRHGAPAAGGVERAARLRRPLGHGRAAVRRRPADRLQLPRPDARDGALRPEHPRARRDVGAVPRLHADRARGRTSPGR